MADELAARLDEQLRARNLQGAWQLVKDNHTFAIESAVVAAGLIALRNGAQAAAEAMLSVKARMRPALDANLIDSGNDRQQRAVHRADGHGFGHYQSGPRAYVGGGPE